jgi:Family of unknown function (DUF6166)
MTADPTGLKYQGFRTADGWEVVVRRPGEPARLLELPRRRGEWALRILTDYFGDEVRAATLHQEFAALTIDRFTEDWVLTASDLENTLMEIEILRARFRMALMRG